MLPSVAVVVLNYQGNRWLEACFSSLLATEYQNLRTILVDNASSDGSVELVRLKFPTVDVIVNSSNRGFAEGNNIGIASAIASEAQYIVLLNPDTKVPAEWLKKLVEVGEREPGVGILGAVQLEYDGEGLNTWTRTAFPHLIEELQSAEESGRWIPVEWVEGACFAVKRRVFDEIGRFDPIYFAFYEEIDFCRRAGLQGWQTALVPESRIHHFRGGSWAADPAIKRERDYRCDRSQFIYTLTEPRRTFAGNLGWYLITLGTKIKEVVRSFSLTRAWDLIRMQFDVLGSSGALFTKWQRERRKSTHLRAVRG